MCVRLCADVRVRADVRVCAGVSLERAVRVGGRTQTEAHLVHAVVEEGQAGVLVADEGALLDEADEHLGLGHQGVQLLVGAVPAAQEACRTPQGLGLVSELGLSSD